jgi:DNA-binding transcriptional MerR regulator
MTDDSRFADGKAPDALRTIGEVAGALNIRQHVLRYWEEQFPMLRPLKRSGGRRYYRPADIALVERIDRLVHREGYTLRGARLAIEGKGDAAQVAPVAAQAAAGEEASFGLRARLVALRHNLVTALQES